MVGLAGVRHGIARGATRHRGSASSDTEYRPAVTLCSWRTGAVGLHSRRAQAVAHRMYASQAHTGCLGSPAGGGRLRARACVRSCMRVFVCARARVCVCVCMRACVAECVCVVCVRVHALRCGRRAAVLRDAELTHLRRPTLRPRSEQRTTRAPSRTPAYRCGCPRSTSMPYRSRPPARPARRVRACECAGPSPRV